MRAVADTTSLLTQAPLKIEGRLLPNDSFHCNFQPTALQRLSLVCVACFQEACTNAMHFYSKNLVKAHNQVADALLTFAATITAILSGSIAEHTKS